MAAAGTGLAAVQRDELGHDRLCLVLLGHTGRTFIGTPDEAIECMMDGR